VRSSSSGKAATRQGFFLRYFRYRGGIRPRRSFRTGLRWLLGRLIHDLANAVAELALTEIAVAIAWWVPLALTRYGAFIKLFGGPPGNGVTDFSQCWFS